MNCIDDALRVANVTTDSFPPDSLPLVPPSLAGESKPWKEKGEPSRARLSSFKKDEESDSEKMGRCSRA